MTDAWGGTRSRTIEWKDPKKPARAALGMDGLDPDESLYNPIGAVHGGAICTVLDSATGCAVHSTLEAGWGYTSIEIKVNYLRGTSDDSGHLTATGRVVKAGSRVAFAEASLVDSQGRLIATATSTLLVFEVRA